MPYIGQPLKRTEDLPLITGRGTYSSDVQFPGTLHLAVLRSPHAHARILEIDVAAAAATAGVVGVYTATDLAPNLHPLPVMPRSPETHIVAVSALAADVVRYVGEPVAVVVAEDRYAAEDGVAKIHVRYDPLPPVVDPERDKDAVPPIHPGWPSNVADHVRVSYGDATTAVKNAALVISDTLVMRRVSGQPMEPRAMLAVYDAKTEVLTVYHYTQSVHGARAALAKALDLPESRVRVVLPQVGGGFGVKNRIYSEDLCAAVLAMRLGRPVKFVADRREEFLSTNQERDQIHHASLAVDAEGRILALTDTFVQDAGAYNMSAGLPTHATLANLTGPYRVPNFDVAYDVVVTNKVPVGPYRGAGRPQGNFVMERLLDQAARSLGMSSVEIREKNLIPPEALPYDTHMMAGPSTIQYTEGDFPAAFHTILKTIDYAGFVKRQHTERDAGTYLGIGVIPYIEQSGTPGFEGAKMRLDPDGSVQISSGSASHGQGHSTVYAQVAADRLGVPLDRIHVLEGDSAAIDRGVGTFGSRSLTAVGNAISQASIVLRRRLLEHAAERLEANSEDLEWQGDFVQVRGVPSARIAYWDVVASSDPALWTEEVYFTTQVTTGFGAHAVIVTVDPETGGLEMNRYAVLQDSGVVVNPLLADGQTIGATVQGLGTALWESVELDADGQPLNTTYLDYTLPGIYEVPDFELFARDCPSAINPEGFKGIGEGGVIPPGALLLQAVENALAPFGVTFRRLPLSPDDVYQALHSEAR